MSEPAYIYVHRDGKELGPFTERELRRHWANGIVDHDDLAWYEGMEGWITVNELFGVPTPASVSIEQEHRDRLFSPPAPKGGPLSGLDTFEFFNGGRIDPLNVVAWVLFVLGVGIMALYRETLIAWAPIFLLSLGFATYNMLSRQKPMTFVLILANLIMPAVLWFTFSEQKVEEKSDETPVTGIERSANELDG
ncbi:MAG: DUF4339 domain-containing protein [Verrucomicrobiota bacterium]